VWRAQTWRQNLLDLLIGGTGARLDKPMTLNWWKKSGA
jgi:hypothetical protein